jgi:hypothetical protein
LFTFTRCSPSAKPADGECAEIIPAMSGRASRTDTSSIGEPVYATASAARREHELFRWSPLTIRRLTLLSGPP